MTRRSGKRRLATGIVRSLPCAEHLSFVYPLARRTPQDHFGFAFPACQFGNGWVSYIRLALPSFDCAQGRSHSLRMTIPRGDGDAAAAHPRLRGIEGSRLFARQLCGVGSGEKVAEHCFLLVVAGAKHTIQVHVHKARGQLRDG